MTDWHSAKEEFEDGVAFTKLVHVMLGIFVWEWITTLDFEWQFISRRKKFKWPLIFYFLNRYCMLGAIISLTITINAKHRIPCQQVTLLTQILGSAAIGFSGINFALRTVAVWSQCRPIAALLTILICGHWSLLLHGILARTTFVSGEGCIVTSTNTTVLAATFIYTMVFDLLILLLNAWKLAMPRDIRGNREEGAVFGETRSKLMTLIFIDGLVYFITAFGINLVAAVFMLLNLNTIMSIVAYMPAAAISTILACRAVRRLLNFSSGVSNYSSSSTDTIIVFRKGRIVEVNLHHDGRAVERALNPEETEGFQHTTIQQYRDDIESLAPSLTPAVEDETWNDSRTLVLGKHRPSVSNGNGDGFSVTPEPGSPTYIKKPPALYICTSNNDRASLTPAIDPKRD